MLGSLFLATDTRYNFCDKTSSVILINCMILMKEYVSLTTAAIKMGKRHFYSDHNNGW